MSKKPNKNDSKGNSKPNNRNGRKGNGRRGNSKPKADDVYKTEEECNEPKGNINDPRFYYSDESVMNQVMNFSFNEFGGVPVEMPSQWSHRMHYHNPMIMSLYTNPSIPRTGVELDKADGATTAALRNFITLSGSNGKTTQYAPQDVLLLILALAEIIKLSSWFKRIFGIAYLFNYRNRTYPEALLRAMKVDYQDFYDNLAQYRIRYNRLLAMAQKIPFPADIPLFKKSEHFFEFLYLDDPSSALAQTYMLNPRSTWILDETSEPTGTILKTMDWCVDIAVPEELIKLSEFLDQFESMISALLNSASLNYIYSDVMRLTQKGVITDLIKFQFVLETDFIDPVYNLEFRDWVHNAFLMGMPEIEPVDDNHTPSNDVYSQPDTNTVFYNPEFHHSTAFGESAFVDFPTDQVTNQMKVEATRFASRCYHHKVNTITDGYPYVTKDFAILDNYVADIQIIPDLDFSPVSLWDMMVDEEVLASSAERMREEFLIDVYLSKFAWGPLRYLGNSNPVNSDNSLAGPVGELNYYTLLDLDFMKRVYDYEIMTLLQIG